MGRRKLTEETIVSVLRYVRAEIIRDGLGGREHVEELLRARGADPEGQHVPRKTERRFRRNQFRAAILRALRGGAETGPEIVRHVAASTNKLTYEEAYSRVYIALHQMRARGLVTSEKDRAGRYVWGLAVDKRWS
jgi:hypothetical protein